MSSILSLFYIEYTKRNIKFDHKLYLFLLALFCEKILIPSRHLLEIGNDSFDILLDNRELFLEGIIFTRIPADKADLKEYYQGIKGEIKDRSEQFKDIRIEKILKFLYSEIGEFGKYNPIDQQEYFSEQISSFIDIYSHKHNSKGLDKIREKCLQRTTKEEFDGFLKQCKKEKDITDETYKKINGASSIIYFLAGASTQQLTVCYDKSLASEAIQSELSDAINNYSNIFNKRYAPMEIVSLLQKLGVIDQPSDLENLTIDDILYLRKQACFKNFIHHYDQYASRSTFDEFFRKERSVFKTICKVKSGIVSLLISILVSVLLLVFKHEVFAIVIGSIVSLVLVAFATYIAQTKLRYEIPFLEVLLDKIIGFFAPVSLFLAKLRWRIISNRLRSS